MRPSNHGFSFLQGQYFATIKGKFLGSGWFCTTATLRPGQPFRPIPIPQIRFASDKSKEWYDWYKRLRADPKASGKDLRKAFIKKAKIEHPDHDKTTGAKARFQSASGIMSST